MSNRSVGLEMTYSSIPGQRQMCCCRYFLPKMNLMFTIVENSNTQNASAGLCLRHGCMLIVMGMLEQAIYHCHRSGVS